MRWVVSEVPRRSRCRGVEHNLDKTSTPLRLQFRCWAQPLPTVGEVETKRDRPMAVDIGTDDRPMSTVIVRQTAPEEFDLAAGKCDDVDTAQQPGIAGTEVAHGCGELQGVGESSHVTPRTLRAPRR
jgi:hypothetical protein